MSIWYGNWKLVNDLANNFQKWFSFYLKDYVKEGTLSLDRGFFNFSKVQVLEFLRTSKPRQIENWYIQVNARKNKLVD